MSNIRKLFGRKTDTQLVVIHSEARSEICLANRRLVEGNILPEEAQTAAEAAIQGTVAAAVARRRIETGDEGSHLDLRQAMRFSRKREDREWGKNLRERRGV